MLAAVSSVHLLNDMMQSLMPAIYPLLKDTLDLNFAQIGLITLTFQLTASMLQPLVGFYTDKRPHALFAAGRHGLHVARPGAARDRRILSAAAVVAARCVGLGSAIFHPESSRVARLASGGRHGLAQSLFQVGGNVGSAIGPLIAAFIVLPFGQGSSAGSWRRGSDRHRAA